MLQSSPPETRMPAMDRSTSPADEARVAYTDAELEARREVAAWPYGDGVNVLLHLTDAAGLSITLLLTPQLSAAVRAALALVDLDGGRCRCPRA